MPFSSKREAIRGRFAPWNMPTTAMRSGVHRRPSHIRHLRTGVGMPMLTLTSTTNHPDRAKAPHVLEESSSVWT